MYQELHRGLKVERSHFPCANNYRANSQVFCQLSCLSLKCGQMVVSTIKQVQNNA